MGYDVRCSDASRRQDLEPDEEETWLESDDEDQLQQLLNPYQDDWMQAYEVSSAVNNPGNDTRGLVEPLDGTQPGLDDFA